MKFLHGHYGIRVKLPGTHSMDLLLYEFCMQWRLLIINPNGKGTIYINIYIYISATGISSVPPFCIELPVIIRSNQWIFLNVKHSSCHSLWCMYLVKRGKLICKSAICKWGNYSKCSKLRLSERAKYCCSIQRQEVQTNTFFPHFTFEDMLCLKKM